MKRLQLFILLMLLTIQVFGQGMSDEQIMHFVQREMKAGASEADIATKLMQKGVTLSQIQSIRQRYASQINQSGMGATADNAINAAQERMRINNEAVEADNGLSKGSGTDLHDQATEAIVTTETGNRHVRRVFGRDIFKNQALTFEPQMNIATPQNYVLGPGDQLVVDIYGATQETHTLTVSPDGDVVMPNYGPIPVSGLTVGAAQNRIRSRLGSYFVSSDIKTSLGQTRTIMINVMGEVKTPGTYSLSAFATVFHALYKAGGINDLGTLRNVKVFRQGRLVTVVDIYEFIINGRLAGNIRLQDNDVVQVGPYESIVDVAGRVKRPMAYELRRDESLATLLKYSGGFTGDAYKKSVRVFRHSDWLKRVHVVEEFDFSSFKMCDGDAVTIDSLYNRYENMAEIKGAVFRAGMFDLGDKVNSVRTLIEAAGGLTEEAMTSRAVMRRMNANRTQRAFPVDVEGILNGSVADVPLENEDLLFIPTLAEHQNLRTLTIEGEVIFPGTYEYADGMTIENLILQAGGLTDLASTAKIDVSRRLYDPKATTSGLEMSKTFSFSLDDQFKIVDGSGFTLEPYDIVQVRRSPIFRAPARVSIEGEVLFAGTYSLEQKNQRLSDLVKAAGGIAEGAYIRGARLVRHMTEDERARMQNVLMMARQNQGGKDSVDLSKLMTATTYSVGIHLDEALANPGCSKDVQLVAGDRLIIPKFNNTVKISGDVFAPNTVVFEDGENYKYYIEQAGGFSKTALRSRTFIVYQNGTMAKASKGTIEPGCEIIVPSKHRRESNATQWLSIATSAASLGTMFATIANLLK